MNFDKETVAEEYAWPEQEKLLLLPVLSDLLGETDGDRVLDVGCGNAWLTSQFDDAVGVDSSKEMIGDAKDHHPGGEYHVMSAEDLDLDESFDTVVSTFTFHLITPKDALRQAFQNVAEHLDENGQFVCLVPHPCFVHENDRGYSTFHVDEPFSYFDDPQTYEAELKTNEGTVRFQSNHYTLQTYFEAFHNADLIVETVREPEVTGELREEHPELWSVEKDKPFFILFKLRHDN